MGSFKHVHLSWGAQIPISAEQFIDGAADWLNIANYLHPEHPFAFLGVDAAPGSESGALPLTRRMWLDKSGMPPEAAATMPDYFTETLIHVDREAHTIIYSVGDGPLGMRNYRATKEAEPLGPDRCRATIHVRFDLPAEISEDDVTPTLIEVYKGVVLGIAHALGPKLDTAV